MYNTYMKRFSKLLIKNQNGLSQKELALALGISLYKIKQWEKGLSQPRIKNIYKICQFFKISPNYLFGF